MSSIDHSGEDSTLLDKLDSLAPIRQFDAFPKVPRTYTKSTGVGGVATIIVIIMSFFLTLNDLGEFVWGWPDTEFSVDLRMKSHLSINLDMVVNMPCQFLSVDVRDAIGDRVHLTSGFRRDGTAFDVGQAQNLHSHAEQQSLNEIVTSARKSGGLFGSWGGSGKSKFKPTYNHIPAGTACRVYGSVEVKRVTGNLHITTLGHGYSSYEHTDHAVMNLSHIITELSFGPYFPDISQPLDNSLEITANPFTVFQYFLTVVPTVYHPARSKPLRTNQYSATNYRRSVEHGRGTPGIFFKYDVEPLEMSIYQRTTTLTQFLIRIAGVVGGVWVCAAWAVKVGMKAVKVVGVVADDDDDTIVKDVKSTKSSLARRWAGGDLRSRNSNQSSGWSVDSGSAFPSPYGGYPSYPATPNYGGSHLNTPSTANGHSYANPAAVPLPITPVQGLPVSPFPGSRPSPGRVDTAPYMNGHGPSSNGSISPLRATPSPVPGYPVAPPSPGTNGTNQPPPPRRNGSGLNPANSNGNLKADGKAD